MNCRRSQLPFWTALVVLAAVRSAAAQTSPPLPSVAAIQVGPLSLYPAIVLRDVGIDSNVFNDATGPKEDFTFTVSPRLQAALRIGATRLIGTSMGDFVYYRTYKDQNSINNLMDGRFEIVSTRLKPFVSTGRVRTRDRTGFEIDARALRVETNITAGVDFEMTSVTTLTGWARRDELTYERGEQFLGVELGDQLNRTAKVAAAGVKVALSPFTTIVGVVEFQQDRFATSPFRNADSVRVAPGVEFAADAAITGRASAGFREFKPLNPSLPRYRGFVASAGVGYTLFGVTHFDVEANRDVMHSFDAAQPYYLASGGRVTIAQRIAGPFDLIALGSRQRLDYQVLDGSEVLGRIETITSAGGGVGIHVKENMRITLTYDRTKRKSSAPGQRDYERRRMLASVNYGL